MLPRTAAANILFETSSCACKHDGIENLGRSDSTMHIASWQAHWHTIYVQSEFLRDAERDVKARFPKAKPGQILDEIIKVASATKSKGHDWPKKLAVDTVKASFAAAKSRRNRSTGSNTSNTTTITATNSVVVLGDQARVTVSPTRQAAALPIAAQTPTKVQATSLGLGPIGSLAHKIHNAHANHHRSAPRKEAITAERRTWDLADGLRFVKSNMDKLAKSLAVTAFASPIRETLRGSDKTASPIATSMRT
ncbi:hypothetical protein HDU88_007125 [Geranomyces variabilis]|nr:hypothetical protein HDU88_007125 [Geranomyces variabilis]